MGSKDKKQRIRRSHSDVVGGPRTFPEAPAGAMANFPLGMMDVSQHMQQQMQQGFMNPALLAQMQGVQGVPGVGAGGAGFPMLGLPAFPMTCVPWAGVQMDAQQQMQNVSQLSVMGTAGSRTSVVSKILGAPERLPPGKTDPRYFSPAPVFYQTRVSETTCRLQTQRECLCVWRAAIHRRSLAETGPHRPSLASKWAGIR